MSTSLQMPLPRHSSTPQKCLLPYKFPQLTSPIKHTPSPLHYQGLLSLVVSLSTNQLSSCSCWIPTHGPTHSKFQSQVPRIEELLQEHSPSFFPCHQPLPLSLYLPWTYNVSKEVCCLVRIGHWHEYYFGKVPILWIFIGEIMLNIIECLLMEIQDFLISAIFHLRINIWRWNGKREWTNYNNTYNAPMSGLCPFFK